MFVTNWISTTKIQKISEITNFFRHYFLSRTEVSYITDYQLTRTYRKQILDYVWIQRKVMGGVCRLHPTLNLSNL